VAIYGSKRIIASTKINIEEAVNEWVREREKKTDGAVRRPSIVYINSGIMLELQQRSGNWPQLQDTPIVSKDDGSRERPFVLD